MNTCIKHINYVYFLEQPGLTNSFSSMQFFILSEIGACFKELADDSDCRAVVLSGAGKIFTAGTFVSKASI